MSTQLVALGLASMLSLALGPPSLPPEHEARPAPADVSLRWTGPEDCRDLARLPARVAEFAPELRIAEAGSAARVEVTLELSRDPHNPQSWRVELELAGHDQLSERRSFAAESCAVAVDAGALVVAVTVDPIAVVETIDASRLAPAPAPQPELPPAPEPEPELPEPELPPEPEPQPQSQPQPLTPRPAPADLGLVLNLPRAEREPPRVSSSPLRVGLALVGGGGYGPLAAGSGVLGARLALLGSRWRAELRGLWLPPIVQGLAPSGRARLDGFSVDARGCGVLEGGPLEFPLCGGLAGGLIRARGEAVNNARSASQPLLQLELSAGLAWAPVERFALGIELEATGQLVSGGFALSGQAVLDNIPVGVRGLAGLELRLP